VKRHGPGFAIAVNLNIETLRECIHDGCSHTVEPPGGGVGARSELSAGVELREHEFQPCETCSWLNIDRDSSSLVVHLDASVGVNLDRDVRSVAAD
jgi:hypothetical protein